MGGQGMERREILRYIGIASVAATFPGFKQWAFACAHAHDAPAAQQSSSGAYQPLFFSPQHFQMIEHLAEMIIPEDDTPGAKSAGVAEFIDFMVANRVPVTASRDIRSTQDAVEMGTDAQQRFLAGLGWMNARCHGEFGHEFMECNSEQQTSEHGNARGKREHPDVQREGLESLGYPGLRLVWPKMPACPHPDDPEHANLREPASSWSAVQAAKN